jgi:F-type H+-transporting ATPase subunit epsilon
MAKTFHLTIAKVGENLFDGEAVSIILPGKDGVFQILADHEAFVSTLAHGEAKVVDLGGEEHRFPIADGGIAEVSGSQTTVLL